MAPGRMQPASTQSRTSGKISLLVVFNATTSFLLLLLFFGSVLGELLSGKV